jgi:hypothetical protein
MTINSNLLNGILASSVKDPVSSSRYMLASHTIVPNYRLNTGDPATLATQRYHVSAITFDRAPWTPNNYKFCWQNAYTLSTGVSPAENDPPTSITIRAAIFNGNTKVVDVTFGGQNEVVIAKGDLVWCDPVTHASLPTTGQLYMRTYSFLPDGGQRPGRRPRGADTRTNIYAGSDQSAALALLVSGAITNNSSFPNNYAFGPVLQVADNWDGRPVVLVVGDSIAAGQDNGEGRSWLTDGIYSSVGTTFGYANLAIHGTRPSSQTGDSVYGKKAALIDTIAAANGGKLPMTCILSQMGVNDAGGKNVAALQSKMQAWWEYIHSKWSKAKLIQTTFTPRVTSDAATLQTDVSVMLSKTLSPADADRWGVSDYIKNTPMPLVGSVDMRSVWTGSPTGTVWSVPAWQGQLTSAAAIGATSIVVDVAPPVGIVPVLSPGSSTTVECTTIPITSVTGTGPYTVALGRALTKAHPVGAVVRATPSADGLHPEEGYFSDQAKAVIEQAKVSGLFN